MNKRIYAGTHKGLVRENNQDRYSTGQLYDNIGYGVLCDGMGGENGGNIASEIAVDTAQKALERDISSEVTELSIRAIFSSIFSAANAIIHDAAAKDPNLKGMGTTMILALLKDDELFVGSVGDSRVYVVNDGKETQLTKDHTVVQMMVDKGELSKEDAIDHPQRHFITRAVGVSDSVEMDFYVYKKKENDIILLCSDGLYSYFKRGEIFPIVYKSLQEKSVDALIQLAKDGGGADNITAVIMV